jgi:hypothetical protein
VNSQTFRDGARWLVAKPIPTLLAGVVLASALAIGTVAFSVLNAAILRPAPYNDGSHIVAVSNFHAQRGSDFGVSPGRFQDLLRDTRSLEDIAAFRTFNQTFVLTGVDEEPARYMAQLLSRGYGETHFDTRRRIRRNCQPATVWRRGVHGHDLIANFDKQE